MSVASPLPFPGSRTIGNWWHELNIYRPLRLWFCHLSLHRVETLVEVIRPAPLDSLRLALLQSLAAGQTPVALEPRFLTLLVRELTKAGLIIPVETGWELTDAGRVACSTGFVDIRSLERRSFYFVDNQAVQGPPHLLPIERSGIPFVPQEPWNFDPELLQAAVCQDSTWKKRFGFPMDITAVRLPDPVDPDWKAVVLDQAEQLFLMFAEVSSEDKGPCLLGFAGQADDWTLDSSNPVIELTKGWEQALPDLAAEPSIDDWYKAWQAWGQSHGLSPDEIEACQLKISGCSLQIKASRQMLDQLHQTHSDVLKGETWLLAGKGRSRAASQVELSVL